MEPYINDWILPVIDLKTMDARKLMNRRLKDVVEINQSMFAGSYEGLRENRKIETESFVMAATFTRTNIRREDLPEGDEINMCKAMDQLFQRFENQGIEKGKLNTLKEQLKVKLGTISSPLEKQLTNTSLEKLNVLTLNIFNVRNEEDKHILNTMFILFYLFYVFHLLNLEFLLDKFLVLFYRVHK